MAPPEVTPAWIVSELDRAREEAANADAIVAFDADGTLWTGDVGLDLYEALLEEGGVRDAARDGLAAEARELGLATDGDTLSIVRALYGAYNADRWPLARAFAAMAWTFAGWHESELDAFAARVTVRARLAERVRPELEPVRAWARERAVDVYVVSASPIAIVALGASALGVPRANVIAMTPAIDARGVVEPRLAGRVVYGDGKLESLRALRPNAALLGAFGDSAYDAAMLRVARVPIAVAPSAGLRAELVDIPRVAVLPCGASVARGGH